MAQGKAVLAPAMANINDLINNEEDGLLFHPGSVASLASRLHELMSSELLRNKLGGSAASKVRSRLNWVQNARTILNML